LRVFVAIIFGDASVPEIVGVSSVGEPHFTMYGNNAHEVACIDGGDRVPIGVLRY
jgi:hypothetical protein